MGAAVATPVRVGGDGGRGPGYWLVLRRVLLGQVAGSLSLLAIATALSWSSLASVDVSSLAMYSPWLIDGAWSLAATVGWGLLVVALVGTLVRAAVQARVGTTLSRGLTFLAVAVGGYAPTLLELSAPARLILTVTLTSALVLVLAFEQSGEPRRLPAAVELSRRRLAVVLPIAAVVLVAPFALLHPLLSFASLERGAFGGNPNPQGQSVYHLRPGGGMELETAMKPGHLPITVTAVRVLGTDGLLRVDAVTVTANSPPDPFVHVAPKLPLRVDAGHALWVSAKLTLVRCRARAFSISAVRVSYRALGLSLTQSVPLDQSLSIAACHR
ncbi:MAG TPA: hypothetical protein VGG41_05245 [Solirubrobacteraceae bacterium]|jgi:hypothetical protein